MSSFSLMPCVHFSNAYTALSLSSSYRTSCKLLVTVFNSSTVRACIVGMHHISLIRLDVARFCIPLDPLPKDCLHLPDCSRPCVDGRFPCLDQPRTLLSETRSLPTCRREGGSLPSGVCSAPPILPTDDMPGGLGHIYAPILLDGLVFPMRHLFARAAEYA